MGQNKEQLTKLLKFIDTLSKEKGNEWFVEELKKIIQVSTDENFLIKEDLNYIRDVLSIKGEISVDYNFIKHDLLRDQLMIDNIRMENSCLELRDKNEVERFYNFCVNAFYQIENIINYYYFITYPNFDDLIKHFEENNKNFVKQIRYKTIADIEIAVKLYTFGNVFFPSRPGSSDSTSFIIQDLRKVRNEGLHRCSIIMSNKEEQEQNSEIYNFFKSQTFNSIRSILKKTVLSVKNSLEIIHLKLNGKITTLLPSSAFITLESGEHLGLDIKLFYKYKSILKINQSIVVEVIVKGGKKIIKDIIEFK